MDNETILDQSELSRWLQGAVEAAIAPAQALSSYFRSSDLTIHTKSDGSPVTVADRDAEKLIRQVLTTHQSLDPIDIVGEEQGVQGSGTRFRWVVDPIDGTRSFVHGVPLFGTIVALEDTETQEAMVGVIHLPVLKVTYSAARGLGAWANGFPLSVSKTETIEEAIVSVGDPLQFVEANCERAYHILADLCRCLRGYTDCFGHVLVASGALGAMLDPSLNPWDILATQVLVEEAGGTVRLRPSRIAGKVDALFGEPDLVSFLAERVGF